MKFEELQKQVLEWAEEKDLLHIENADRQFMKFIEEVFEFKTEMDSFIITRNFRKMKQAHLELISEMGDIFVTLIILCKQLDVDSVECLDLAYKKIKDRNGKTINGTFVKSEDLENARV